MIIDITLYADAFLRHNEIIELPEDTVELFIHPTAHSVGTLTLSLKHGETERQYKIKDEPIDVTEMFSEAGEVLASVTLSVRGEVARRWQIEPFCIRKIDSGLEVLPALEALKERVSTLEQAVTELAKLITDN